MKKQKKYNFYIAKIVQATSIKEALKKEKEVEPFDIQRTSLSNDPVHVSTIGFASNPPK